MYALPWHAGEPSPSPRAGAGCQNGVVLGRRDSICIGARPVLEYTKPEIVSGWNTYLPWRMMDGVDKRTRVEKWPMSDMIEVVIDSIRVSLMSQQRIVILRESDAERYLPIWIGVYEAEAITIALQEVEVARPLTHDLLKNIFGALDARILRVEVTALRDDTFFGNIVAEVDGRTLNIDARPSDALNLAVRVHVPILVAREVMDAAGIIPEEDMQEESKGESAAAEEDIEASEERLSIFEDFLEGLDIEPDDEEDDED